MTEMAQGEMDVSGCPKGLAWSQRDTAGSGTRGLSIAVALCLVLAMSGCAVFRPAKPMVVPTAFLASNQAALMTNPQTRQAAYAKLFPSMPKLQLSGDMVARGHWWQGKQYFETLFFALAPKPVPGPQPLHMRGFIKQTSLFDVIVRDHYMTVLLHPDKAIFQGPVMDDQSPFGKRFGVEPWDLITIFILGEDIAGGSFKSETGAKAITLKPAGGEPGSRLKLIQLDKRSGLPELAVWKSGKETYRVRYLAWDYFTDSLTGEETRLMPSKVEIQRDKPKTTITLTVSKYQFNKQYSEKIFQAFVDSPYREFPLEKLNEVFGN